MDIVENIEAYCKRNGLTDKAFERKCGLYNNSVRRWRLGIYKSPTMTTVQKIAAATGIPAMNWVTKGGVM